MACKSEHDVPIGVQRTWVKQVETGVFPDVSRSFHVMRCNHCADAPCVEICPVTALHYRPEGIVDFDDDRCIGCKACMQACPYDALYIDPRSGTAAKCNFCAHRTEIGLAPACVVACPEQAIVAGDLASPTSAIAHLVATQPVSVRKPEKGTNPSLFYIDGDHVALDPLLLDAGRCSATDRSDGLNAHPGTARGQPAGDGAGPRPLAAIGVAGFLARGAGGQAHAQAYYDPPRNGTPWGREVSAYLSTKALAAGAAFVPLLGWLALGHGLDRGFLLAALALSLLFQAATAVLLVTDLERPDRFLNVLLRGNPSSWLVRGAWILTAFGGLTTLAAAALLLADPDVNGGMAWEALAPVLGWGALLLAGPAAGYTAFLFAQAKGRDLWQSPLQPVHMLGHMLVAGAAGTLLLDLVVAAPAGTAVLARALLVGAVALDLVLLAAEAWLPHGSKAAALAIAAMTSGAHGARLVLLVIVPSVLAIACAGPLDVPAAGAALALVALAVRNDLWVRVPQEIPLS